MAFSEALAERIRDAVGQRPNLNEMKMFGGLVLMLNGNVLVGVWKESLVVRLGTHEAEAALLEPHVKAFDITGRPMQGWILVAPAGIEQDDQLMEWIERATRFVQSLPKK
jgi:hypothetical protein